MLSRLRGSEATAGTIASRSIASSRGARFWVSRKSRPQRQPNRNAVDSIAVGTDAPHDPSQGHRYSRPRPSKPIMARPRLSRWTAKKRLARSRAATKKIRL
jgi:hypothetical protein